ncbi:hypothetical protein Phum_PHUM362260 [Pediculus humanus corporis]|uniref:Uncharacterized protein n=1 Tax=Pediculus humanus subsp. corporis TaxID=121224 RepID=E0VPN7_PEDHC|nr:uncharacterized protein Phum_PHUM362260 [Pediculus humanus corporis]EEB15343.1 hypothetical protein Phum_PHUM362260 [Pediculus humanus corporis]
MTMLSSSLLIIATVIIFIADYGKSYPHIIKIDDRRSSLLDERCRQCNFNEDCFDEPAGGCVNGVYKDKCGYINCFKGPGEHCDKTGKNKCAPNLLCKCNVCKGCQKNRLKVYQCFYGDDKMCLGDLASDEKF